MSTASAVLSQPASATTFKCGECGAELAMGNYRTAVCPYCASPSVVERPAAPDRPNPVFVVPFTTTKERAVQAVKDWQSRARLVHRSLADSTVEEIKGVYVPAYLYSCVASSSYSAEIGENYTVVETYTTTVNGKTVTRTRTRTKTEWRSLSGQHAAYSTDLVVSASRGLPNEELEHIEPFDMRGLRRYQAELVSGWLVEEPSRSLDACTELCRGEALELERTRLSAFMPGDSHRNLNFSLQVSSESIDPMLVPVWVLAVRPDPQTPAMRVVVNGQSGEVWGPERLSPIKILLWIGMVIALIVVVAIIGASM